MPKKTLGQADLFVRAVRPKGGGEIYVDEMGLGESFKNTRSELAAFGPDYLGQLEVSQGSIVDANGRAHSGAHAHSLPVDTLGARGAVGVDRFLHPKSIISAWNLRFQPSFMLLQW